MTDYYKLYDYCLKTFEKKNSYRQQYLANKKSKLKKELFNTIIEDSNNIIRENAEEGFDYAIIYDDEYNELIYELLDSLVVHFKPFNVIYKKKTHIQRGFLEMLTDETNYVIMIDWKKKQDSKKIDIEEKHNDKTSIIYSNISELPSKNVLNEELKIENTILDKQMDEKEKIDEDNIINKFGFETIF